MIKIAKSNTLNNGNSDTGCDLIVSEFLFVRRNNMVQSENDLETV